MKHLSGSSGIRWIFVCSLLILAGCSSATQAVFIEDHGHEYTARNLEELKEYMNSPESYASKVKWKEITYPMVDGYYGFVEPIGKNCDMHWRVNRKTRIVGYDTKGPGCDTTRSSDLEFGNLQSIGKDNDGNTPWKGGPVSK
jgi:hypothetical protein